MPRCPGCQCGVRTHKDGTIVLHAIFGEWCPGSGQLCDAMAEVKDRQSLSRQLMRRVRA